MKTKSGRSSFLYSVASLSALICYLILATGSEDLFTAFDIEVQKRMVGIGIYEEIETHELEPHSITRTGPQDDKGRWNGWILIEYRNSDFELIYDERVYMVHGRRNGLCTRTYPDGTEVEEHYLNGMKIGLKKALPAGPAEGPAFELLRDRYPWYLFMLEAFGYNAGFTEQYLDTLELLLGTYTFDPADFDTYYEQVVDTLGGTAYNSLVLKSNTLTGSIGIRNMKDDELRQAVIDYYRTGNASLYSILITTYPNYVLEMNNSEISLTDLQAFCSDMEDSLSIFGSVDPEDDFFVDTADARFYAALTSFVNTDLKKSVPALQGDYPERASLTELSSVRKEAGMLHDPHHGMATPGDVAGIALNNIIELLLEGDYIKQVVRDAYMAGEGIPGLPTAGTEYISGPSATSANLGGYIMEDGGAAVTERGIVWAGHHTPTLEDQAEISGTGTGGFTVTLQGLTEGNNYYARSYAVNSAGTAYGNLISFKAQSTVGTEDQLWDAFTFELFPNPASEMVLLRMTDPPEGTLEIQVLDMSGRIVYHRMMPSSGDKSLEYRFGLPGIADGIYWCQIIKNGDPVAVRTLLITR